MREGKEGGEGCGDMMCWTGSMERGEGAELEAGGKHLVVERPLFASLLRS